MVEAKKRFDADKQLQKRKFELAQRFSVGDRHRVANGVIILWVINYTFWNKRVIP
ncbi:hypothetical protein H6G93_37150 [Nostoc sp. FACHB-973]|nr:hypothetical protein [Nostoc sp. FACHB-973]